MGNPSENPSADRLKFPLAWKLSIGLMIVASMLVFFLVTCFGPHARATFQERSGSLLALGRDSLREMVRANTSESRELLLQLIGHTADSRRRLMGDLPYSLYGGDVARIRQVLESMDAERSLKLKQNVGLHTQAVMKLLLIFLMPL